MLGTERAQFSQSVHANADARARQTSLTREDKIDKFHGAAGFPFLHLDQQEEEKEALLWELHLLYIVGQIIKA